MARGRCREVEPTTKVINATCTVWNFQKPAWNARKMSGNFILVALCEPWKHMNVRQRGPSFGLHTQASTSLNSALAAHVSQTCGQQCFTILEVASAWHEAVWWVVCYMHWCSQGQSRKDEASTLKAKVGNFEAKAIRLETFKHTAWAEMKIPQYVWQPDMIGNELHFYWFLLITIVNFIIFLVFDGDAKNCQWSSQGQGLDVWGQGRKKIGLKAKAWHRRLHHWLYVNCNFM